MYVRLVFWDHAENSPPLKFEIAGRIAEEDGLSYTIASWHYPGEDWTGGGDEQNIHYYSILKSTVVEKEILIPNSSI